MLKKLYITISLILVAQIAVLAQDKSESQNLKAARKDYQNLKYVSAIKILKAELKENPGSRDALEMIADSYRNIKDYDNSVLWYSELTKQSDIKPEWALYYAEALANKEQYEASEQWYNKYMQLTTKEQRATSFVQAYSHLNDFLKNRGDWKISYLNINTKAAEYSPMYYKNGLMFISNRKPAGLVKGVFEWDQTPFSDIFFVENINDIKGINPDSVMKMLREELRASGRKLYKENDDDTEPTSNDSKVLNSFNIRLLRDTLGDYLMTKIKADPVVGAMNSKYHEGSAAVLPNGDIMFTRNNYFEGKYKESKEGVNKLKLYTAKAPGFDDITPFPYNNDQYSVGHPALNRAGTLLIFASDMPGGQGGTDLYYCKRVTTNDAWGKPVNMGPMVNTKGNEMFPTLYRDSTLFFSSNGLAGLGGLDIFRVALNDVEPQQNPINIGAPINSSTDDFGFITAADGRSGFFTSDRKNSDDIYSFGYLPWSIKLKGVVVDANTDRVIENSTVTISPEGTPALQSDAMGKFSKVLTTKTDYVLTAAKAGYLPGVQATLSTKGITRDTTLTVTLKLSKVPVKPPFNCDSAKALVAVRKIYYDLDKSFIRPDAQPELAQLMDVLNKHPDFNVILASHCDMRASVQYNIALSQRRSLSSRAYLIQHGISPSRIKIEYYGKSRLVNKCADGVNCDEAEHQLNRRTEFILIKNGKELQDIDCDWLTKEFGSK